MATKLYLRTGLSEWSSGNNDARLDTVAAAWINQPLSLTAGSSAISNTISTVTGPTNGLENPSGSLGRAFISQPLDADVTISGSVTWNIWASESNMSANVAINGRLEVIDGATGTITLIDQTARTTELGFSGSNTVQNFSETPAAGVACKRGDRLRVRIYGDDSAAATMATGYTFSYSLDGGTAAADGDTWLQLTENLTFVSEPAGTTVYPTDTASAVSVTQSVAGLLSSFTGSDENPLSEGGNWADLNPANSGELKRASNQATIATAATIGAAYWTPADFGPDVEAYVTVVTAPTVSDSVQILARVQSAGGSNTHDGYAVRVSATDTRIVTVTNGTNGAPLLQVTRTPANGDKIGIRCHGDRVSAWVQPSGGSWANLGTVIDSTYPAAGKVAVHSAGTSPVFDDVYAGTAYDTFTGGSAGAAITEREAWTSRGAGVQTDVRNTAAGYTAPLQITDTAGGTVVDWFTRQLTAFTLGGAVRVNARALESATAANASIRCEIARVDSDGTSPTVWGAMTFGTEMTASEAAQSFLVSGDDLAVTDGQRLRIRFYIDDAGIGTGGAMAASQTVTLYYAGTSGGASGDTYLTFTQTLTEFAAGGAEDPMPYTGGGYYG